ncbi:MAG: glycosyltransferase, partial [Anaerolineae bacterium]|nr:glycosyltransferase [Anaerolineae bacterium]
MNILIVIDRYYPIGGGIQQYIRGLARTLTGMGHSITILTQTDEDAPEQEQWEEGMILRTPILKDTLPHPEVMLERWPQLVPYIEAVQPDVIYANNHTSIGTIQAAHAANVPVVYSCHGWGLFCPLKIRLIKPDQSLCHNDRSLENCLRCSDLRNPPVPPRIKGMGRTLVKSTYERLNWQRIRRKEFAPLVQRYDRYQDILESAQARIANSRLTASFFRSPRTYPIYLGLDTAEFRPVESHTFRERYQLGDAPYI